MKTDLVVGAYIFHENKLILIKHKKSGLWLPVGGHMDNDEVPDDAIMREAKEELNIDIKLLGFPGLPIAGNTKRNLATPFHVNIHTVKDHDHCCFFYLAQAIDLSVIKPNPKEVDDYMLIAEDEIFQKNLPEDVKFISILAFKELKKISK